MTGVIPRRAQVRDGGDLSDWRIGLRRRSSRRGPPPSFYPRPGLLLPYLDRAVIALDGPACAQLAGPPAAAQQVLDPRCGAGHPELPGDQVPDAASARGWSVHPAAGGPASSTVSSAAGCPSSRRHTAQPARGSRPWPGRPPARHAAATARPLADPQLRGGHRRRRPLPGPVHRFQPGQLPASSALGGQPAALPVPHEPGKQRLAAAARLARARQKFRETTTLKL
jgi:hypothetical protein